MARLHRIIAPLSLPLSLALLAGPMSSCDKGDSDPAQDSNDTGDKNDDSKKGVDTGKGGGDRDKPKKPGGKLPGPDGQLPDDKKGESDDENGDGIPDCSDPDDPNCFPIDILFVVDNSGTMGEEQKNLAANFSKLVEKLKNLKNKEGGRATPLVNMMVTTTDMGHPECTPFEPKGYDPRRGSPVKTTCLERLDDFQTLTKVDGKPEKFFDACEDVCDSKKFKPKGNFIAFGPGGLGSNVPGNDISKALSCVGPQGVNGCGYEAPLESMMQALDRGKKWNKGKHPFLRKGSLVAVVIVTDEADCSVRGAAKPEDSGYVWFTDPKKRDFCEEKPATDKAKAQKKPSSAVCWNAGVKCSGLDGDVYKKCVSANLPSEDAPVLHPISRYTKYFDYLKKHNKNEIVMLGILGVPEVTKHSDTAPFEPIEGGVKALKYRKWRKSDLPKDAPDNALALKNFEFGIGPGCTGDGTGQGIPPVRIKEVCEHLNTKDKKGKVEKVHCCIESICDDDFSAAINCLSGLIENVEPPK